MRHMTALAGQPTMPAGQAAQTCASTRGELTGLGVCVRGQCTVLQGIPKAAYWGHANPMRITTSLSLSGMGVTARLKFSSGSCKYNRRSQPFCLYKQVSMAGSRTVDRSAQADRPAILLTTGPMDPDICVSLGSARVWTGL
jgi:hypothetical protein